MPFDPITLMLLVLTASAALTDARSGLIPNWLTLPVLASAPLAQLAHGGGPALGRSLLGVALCAAIPALLFRAGAMGGGDVKLLGAIGALAGPLRGLEIQLLAYHVLVLLACFTLACERRLMPVLLRTWRLLRSCLSRSGAQVEHEPNASFRLGVPIFVAACALIAIEAVR